MFFVVLLASLLHFGAANQLVATDTTNQIVLGTTNTMTITSPAPSTSRTVTLPDPGTTGASIVITESDQNIDGVKTFEDPPYISSTSYTKLKALLSSATSVYGRILSVSNSNPNVGISYNWYRTDSGSPTTYAYDTNTLPISWLHIGNDGGLYYYSQVAGTAADDISSGGTRFIVKVDGKVGIGVDSPGEKLEVNGNVKAAVAKITATSNQLLIGSTVTTISVTAPSAARTVTLPDAGANSNFVLTEGTQTINGEKTFGTGIKLPTSGGTASTMNFYSEYAATGSCTYGTDFTDTCNLYYVRKNREVTIYTNSAVSFSVTTNTYVVFNYLPGTEYRPSSTLSFPIYITGQSAGTGTDGYEAQMFQITSAGVMKIFPDRIQQNFYQPQTISWPSGLRLASYIV